MTRPEPDPLRLAAWRSFLEVHLRVTEHLDNELRQLQSLPITWYDVLVQLDEAGGRRRMSDLAEAALLSRSNCTRLVDRMVEADLVSRIADPEDARVRWAVMTEVGKQRLVSAAPDHLAGVEEIFTSHLDDGTAERMVAAFGNILAALDGSVVD